MQIARLANQARQIRGYRIDQGILDAVAHQVLFHPFQNFFRILALFGIKHVHLVDHEDETILALFTALAHCLADQFEQIAVIVNAQLAGVQDIQDQRIAPRILDETHGDSLVILILAVVRPGGIGQHQTYIVAVPDGRNRPSSSIVAVSSIRFHR